MVVRLSFALPDTSLFAKSQVIDRDPKTDNIVRLQVLTKRFQIPFKKSNFRGFNFQTMFFGISIYSVSRLLQLSFCSISSLAAPTKLLIVTQNDGWLPSSFDES